MNLDTACFKAFQCAAEVLNFTEAARLAGMTQSGVSQHISKLEAELGDELFYRVGKKVILTDSGKKLLEFIEKYNDAIQGLSESIQGGKEALTGKVRYAMPESCLLSPHFSILLKEKHSKFSSIQLEVDLCASDAVIENVLSNTVDFGFVTKKTPNENLIYTEFCDEEYVLTSSKNENVSQRDLHDHQWVHYPGHEVLLEKWSSHHKIKNEDAFSFHGKTNSMHAALTMVAHGLGIAIFPSHCVETSDLKAKLRTHSIDSKKCKNTIYIVTLNSKSHPKRVQKVVETFLRMK
ncbi:LysR family transcriptional regulator [Bdellovibrio sp. HCB337]|uniref:LysR family transcriptional regulator n=1 Tax=Bdellovibrio sp. HCB337 TaxID=3394358 RepID=UPI0039A45395